MKIHQLVLLAGMVIGLGLTADDQPNPEQLRRQARELQARAAELEKARKSDAAKAASRKARELLEVAKKIERERGGGRVRAKEGGEDRSSGQREFDQWLRQQELRLRQLREQGKAEQAEELRRYVERVVAERRNGRRGHPEKEGSNGQERPQGERARHLAVAIEHLHAAGLHELANNLARELEGEQEGPRRVERDRDRPEPGVAELREEVAHLRELLHRLIRERSEDKEREGDDAPDVRPNKRERDKPRNRDR